MINEPSLTSCDQPHRADPIRRRGPALVQGAHHQWQIVALRRHPTWCVPTLVPTTIDFRCVEPSVRRSKKSLLNHTQLWTSRTRMCTSSPSTSPFLQSIYWQLISKRIMISHRIIREQCCDKLMTVDLSLRRKSSPINGSSSAIIDHNWPCLWIRNNHP